MNKNDLVTAQIVPTNTRQHNARILRQENKGNEFETLAVVLIAFWLMALGFGFTLGGYVHILLLGAIVMTLLHFKHDRRFLS